MSIIASCGHEVFSGDDLFPVEYPDEAIDHDEGAFVPVTVTAMFCRQCADKIGALGGRVVTHLTF